LIEKLRRLAPPATASARVEAPRAEWLAMRRTEVDADRRHGRVTLRSCLRADPARLAEAGRAPRLAEAPVACLAFVDTETTALGGGAGVLVFLVGVARFEGSKLSLRQHFLRRPSEERAFLERVREDLASATGLVTFCGKSFDRWRLEDRFRFHGVPPVFDRDRHLDLVHPLRRAVRGVPDHRLRTLEVHLLGLERRDDLDGRFAPQAYFDYLADRRGPLERVFEHNRLDVLSLVALTAVLGGAGMGVDAFP
jgi:hypothetical protein